MEPVFLSPDYFSEYSHSLTILLLSVGGLAGLCFGYAAWGYRRRSTKLAFTHSRDLEKQVQEMQNYRRRLLDQMDTPEHG